MIKAVLSLPVIFPCIALPSPAADTSFGKLFGRSLVDVDEFLGIPYAESTEGQNRFAAPKDWSKLFLAGSRNATRYAARCPQAKLDDTKIGYSEDCLFLNVWTPRALRARTELAPVMVFIYGGSFISGSADLYNGTELATATETVVVNMNYRVGALGFVQVGVAPAGANFGLLDQQAALRYIQKEVVAFNGDASRVLLFGQSSGAHSAGLHFFMSGSTGLYRRLLMESGHPEALPMGYARWVGNNFSARLNCSKIQSRLACLRNASLADVLDVQADMLTPGPGQTEWDVPFSFWSTVDGKVIEEDPLLLLQAGRFNKGSVEIAMGINSQELVFAAYSDWLHPVSAFTFNATVKSALRKRGQRYADNSLTKLYAAYVRTAVAQFDLRPQLGQLLSDMVFICRARHALQALTKVGVPTFKYLFEHRAVYDPSPSTWGNYHSAELPFVFGLSERGSIMTLTNMTLSERQLMGDMRSLWSSFARDGMPRTMRGWKWPKYNKSSDNHLILNTSLRDSPLLVGSNFHKSWCDTWDAISDRAEEYFRILL